MSNTDQIPFKLEHKTSYAFEDYIVSGSNSAAYDLVSGGIVWPNQFLAVIGQKGSGKTHLAESWAIDHDAVIYKSGLVPSSISAGSKVLIDDVDEKLKLGEISEQDLFHIYNWTKENAGLLLITSKTHLNRLDIKLPDLKSRFGTFHIAEISSPDDYLLRVLLEKLFSDRQLTIDVKVIDYIITRMDRSFEAAHILVTKLDETALSKQQKITVPLVKSCFEAQTA